MLTNEIVGKAKMKKKTLFILGFLVLNLAMIALSLTGGQWLATSIPVAQSISGARQAGWLGEVSQQKMGSLLITQGRFELSDASSVQKIMGLDLKPTIGGKD